MIVTREQYGVPQTNSRLSALPKPVGMAVIHHTAGAAGSDFHATVRGLHRFATRSRVLGGKGLTDVQYHYLVAPDGTIFQGRANAANGDLAVGAHTPGWNHNTIAVCLLGNFQTGTPTPSAIEATIRVLDFLNAFGFLRPDSFIVGHRDLGGLNGSYRTACPGNALYAALWQIRDGYALAAA